MKKVLLVLGISILGFTGFAAPQWDKSAPLLESDFFALTTKVIASYVASDILIAQPNPSSAIEIKRYNYAHAILEAKADSKLIYSIMSIVIKDGIITDLDNPQQMKDEIHNYIQSNFDIIGKIY